MFSISGQRCQSPGVSPTSTSGYPSLENPVPPNLRSWSRSFHARAPKPINPSDKVEAKEPQRKPPNEIFKRRSPSWRFQVKVNNRKFPSESSQPEYPKHNIPNEKFQRTCSRNTFEGKNPRGYHQVKKPKRKVQTIHPEWKSPSESSWAKVSKRTITMGSF